MYRILQIKELKDFKCTGKNCIDSCCHSWNIHIDKYTYKKYAKKKKIGVSHIVKLNSTNPLSYAEIKLNENKECPYLCADGLCFIHKNYGESMLSNTCQRYPKKAIKYSGNIEKSFDLSCPSVVKMLLKSKSPLEFDLDICKDNIKDVLGLNKDAVVLEGFSQDACFALRSLAISIVQNREISLKERLYQLGRVSEIIQNLIDNKFPSDEILAYILELENNFKNDDMLKYKEESILTKDNKYDLIEKISEIYKNVFAGIETKAGGVFKKQIDEYVNAGDTVDVDARRKFKEDVVNKFMSSNEYIFEHFIVYHLFTQGFPKNAKNVELAFKSILNNLLSLELFMLCVQYKSEELTKEDLENAIYYSERQVGHSKLRTTLIDTFFSKVNLNWTDALELIF